MKGYTLEQFWRVYDDGCGQFVEVREDRDGLGLVEVVQEKQIVTMTTEQARLVVKALTEMADYLDDKGQP